MPHSRKDFIYILNNLINLPHNANYTTFPRTNHITLINRNTYKYINTYLIMKKRGIKKMKKVSLNGSKVRVRLSSSIKLDKFPKRLKVGSFKIPKSLEKIAHKISI